MRGVCVVVSFAVAVTACSGGSDDQSAQSDPTLVSAAPSSAPATDAFTDADTVPPRENVDGPLAEVCPAEIGIQTAGLPGVPVGPLHRLLGDTGEIDEARQSVRGPLTRVDGTVEDVVLEVRSGGPAIGFLSPLELLAADDTLLLAQASTAAVALESESTQVTGVVTLTDATHQVIIWDPATYPDVDDFAGLRAQAVEIRHLTNAPVIDYLVNAGELDASQTTPGFDGEPASFVAAQGQIGFLGDLLVDPALLESLPQWGRPVATLSPQPVGWVGHDDMLVARADDLDAQGDCLARLVPIIQEAIVAYANDPAPTNVSMSTARQLANPLTRLTPAQMDAGVAAGMAAGVFGNGDDQTVGEFDLDELEPFVEEVLAPTDIPSVEIDSIATNEFIDPAVGF